MISIMIAGNVSQDAETRHTPNGDAVANWSVASNQGKDKPAIFLRCSLFGKRAESLAPYLKKGTAVTVVGTLTERVYQDKTTGADKKAQEIKVSEVVLQGSRQAQEAPKTPVKQAAKPHGGAGTFDDMSDVPF